MTSKNGSQNMVNQERDLTFSGIARFVVAELVVMLTPVLA